MTEREREHIRAALAYSKGNLPQACLHWSNILIKNPLGKAEAVHSLFICLCLRCTGNQVCNVGLPRSRRNDEAERYDGICCGSLE